MSNGTRFVLINRIEQSIASLKNGTGGAPARDEVTGFLMERMMNSDRHTLWKQNSGANMNVDIDLGADVGINIGALLGHRPTVAGAAGITSADVFGVPAAAGYPPAGWGVSFGTIALASGRDAGVGMADHTVRYVRFALTVGSPFTLGRMVIGAIEVDFLQRYAQPPSGSPTRDYVQPRRETGLIGDARAYNWIGDGYMRVTFPYLADVTLRNKLIALVAKKQTVVYMDHDGVFREMLVIGVSEATVFEGSAANARYQMQLDMVQLG